MATIRLEFDRLESYALLVVHEFLRQLISGGEGIPFIRMISPVSSNTEYTEVRFIFEFKGDYTLAIKVDAGDVWPKKGVAHLIRIDISAGQVRYDFELQGKPDEPQVVFTKMRGGG